MDETAQGGAPAPAEPKELPADGMARAPVAAADEAPPQAVGSALSADAASLSSVIDTARAAADDLAAVFDGPDEGDAGPPLPEPTADGAPPDMAADGALASAKVAVPEPPQAEGVQPEPGRAEDPPAPAAVDHAGGEASAGGHATPAGAGDGLPTESSLAEAEGSAEPLKSDAPGAEAAAPLRALEDPVEWPEEPSADAPEASAPEPGSAELAAPEPSAPEATPPPEPGDDSAEPALAEAGAGAEQAAAPEESDAEAPSALDPAKPEVTATVALGDPSPVEVVPGPPEDEAAAAAHPIVEVLEAYDRFQEDLEAAPPGIAAAPAAGPSAGSGELAPAQAEASLEARPGDTPGAEPASVPSPVRPAEAVVVATDAAPDPALGGHVTDADNADRQDAAPGAGDGPAVTDAGSPSQPAAQPTAGEPAPGATATAEPAWRATPAVPLDLAPAPVPAAGPAERMGPEVPQAGLREPSPAWRVPPAEDVVRVARPLVRHALRGAALAAAGLAATVLVLIVAYRWVNPPISTLMLGQSLAGTPIERTWVPIERVSPNLIRAVVLSEDAAFCRHRGVDWRAIGEAMEDARGGSTITMQVVKNLFLWPSRSYVRKAIEIGLAYLVEAVWSKRRIMEIYLNIAEWGDGIFGAEAAARAHFDKRAAQLTAQEAALLAVSLPNPIERTPAAPSLGTGRLASRLMLRMATARPDLSCLPVPRRPQRSAPKKAPLVPGP